MYLLAYVLDPLIIALQLLPIAHKGFRVVQNFISGFIIIDIFLMPFTGTKVDEGDIYKKENRKKKKKNIETKGYRTVPDRLQKGKN